MNENYTRHKSLRHYIEVNKIPMYKELLCKDKYEQQYAIRANNYL